MIWKLLEKEMEKKGNPEKMRTAFESALQQAETVLKKCVFSLDDEILVISKSIGIRLPLFLKKDANHSLETGNALTDAISIRGIIIECQSYLLNLDVWKDCDDSALKRNLLKTIVDNNYYDEYGCYDPMHDLSRALCKCKEDKLLLADYLWAAGKSYHKEAAEISLENGKEDYYIQYLYESLGKNPNRIQKQ